MEVLKHAGVQPGEVSDVILGQVLTAGAGQNPARQAAVAAGVPVEVPAMGVNQLCGSGLRAVALGWQALQCGDADIVVAGGQESMSQSPHCMNVRMPTKLGDVSMVDTMIRDGLWDAFHGYHMGNTAENLARQWKIGREEQDEFAARSQQKAAAAQAAGGWGSRCASSGHKRGGVVAFPYGILFILSRANFGGRCDLLVAGRVRAFESKVWSPWAVATALRCRAPARHGNGVPWRQSAPY